MHSYRYICRCQARNPAPSGAATSGTIASRAAGWRRGPLPVRVLLLGLLVLLLPAGAGAQAPAPAPATPVQFGGDAAHRGVLDTRGLDGYGGILWRAELPGPVRSAAAVHDGRVYVGSAGGHLHALDRWTGRELWRYRAGAAVHGSPAVWRGTVYVTDASGSLHAVDRRTGDRRWTVETGPVMPWAWGHESGDLYLSSPVLAEVAGRMGLWFGAGDGRLRAVDPRDGRVLWSLETDGRVRSTPAVADGTVVVGSADGSVYAADAADGTLRWRWDSPGRALDSGEYGFDRKTVQSSPAIAHGRVYVGTRSGSLYALDLGTGTEIWESSHGSSWVNGSPAVAGGRVFAGSSDGRFLQAVDAETGRELWRRESGVSWSSPVVVEGAVHFVEASGRVRALDVADGSTRWAADLPADSWASPVVDEGVLFLGSDDGFYALRSAGGAPFHRAVFWDSAYTRARWYLGHRRLAGRLADHGYERLDAAGLERWLADRIEDRDPGTLVLALDRLPDPVQEGGAESLFRRYLDAGGTVVAPGLPPGIWPRDPETGETGGLSAVRWEEASGLLGVDLDAAIFDAVGARATPAGRALGLPPRFLASWTVDPQPGLEPLAVDENGRYAAWRKSYGGAPGTGLVRIWPSRRRLEDLVPFLTAAELRPADPARDPVPGPTARAEVLDAFAEEGMRRLGVPGMAFAAVEADGGTVQRGWGVRDVEQGGAVGPGTGFYVASSTKSFVGLLTVLLDRRGWVDLDAPLTDCLPELDLNDVVDPASVTLRDLLRHTRGWESDPTTVRTAYVDFLGPRELREHLSRAATRDDASDGGFDYGNIGYVAVDLCFREALGVDWKELVETQLLVPLGMDRTTPFVSEAAATGELALPHLWDGRRHRRVRHKIDDLMHAAGGLVTTARDAAAWIRVHLGEGTLDGRRVFPAGAVREVLTRQVDADLSFWEFSREGYGLGWFDGRYRGDRLLHHFGGYRGAQAHVSLMPDRGLGVAAFVNGGGGNAYLLPHLAAALWYDLARGRDDALAHARAALDSAVADGEERQQRLRTRLAELERRATRHDAPPGPERYTGMYRHPGLGTVIVTRTAGGGLWANWGAREGPLLANPDAGPRAFEADWEPGRAPDPVVFRLPEEGRATGFLWRGRLEVPRVEPPGRGTGGV